METRLFGATGMRITPVGFGAWAIGGGNWEFAWGPQDDDQSVAAIHRALDLGINWIDTAAVYGLGHSEEIVARALKGISQRPYVFTKGSMIWNEQRQITHSLKRDSLRREVEASLRRLQTDTIDLYQVHWPDPDPEIEEGWSALTELKKEGKLRHIGVSNFNSGQMRRAMAIAPVETLQPPYSLVRRDVGTEILPFAREHNIGVIVYSPMYSGLLTGTMTRERIASMPADDWRKRDAQFQEPNLSRNLRLVESLRQIGQRYGRSAGEVAITWTLHNRAVTGAIVGGRSASQVEGIIGAADLHLSEDDLQAIETASEQESYR